MCCSSDHCSCFSLVILVYLRDNYKCNEATVTHHWKIADTTGLTTGFWFSGRIDMTFLTVFVWVQDFSSISASPKFMIFKQRLAHVVPSMNFRYLHFPLIIKGFVCWPFTDNALFHFCIFCVGNIAISCLPKMGFHKIEILGCRSIMFYL